MHYRGTTASMENSLRVQCGQHSSAGAPCEAFARAIVRALRATFERRRTSIPESLPLALTPEFAAIHGKQVQWQGFLRKNGLKSAPAELGDVVACIAMFLDPVIAAARDEAPPKLTWQPGGPWQSAMKETAP